MKVYIAKAAKKAVCSLMALTMSITPMWAFGAENNMSAIGHDAQSFAEELSGDIVNNMPELNGSTLNIKMPSGQSVQLDTNELKSQSSSVQYQYDDSYINRIQNYYDDPNALDDKGEEEKENLYKNATSDSPTIEGHAYAVVMDLANKEKPDLSSDPVLDTTKDLMDRIVEVAAGLGTCETDKQIVDSTTVVHMPDYEQCTQVLDRSGTCKIIHSYEAGVIRHYDGPYNLSNCGDGCTQLWIGKVGDNYWSGTCKVYEEWTQVYVPNPTAVTKAILEYAKWDDYMQVYVGPPGRETMVWAGPYGADVFPPETSGSCELNTSWEQSINVDVTRFFRNVKANDVVSFKIRASVTGGGEAYGRIKVYYDTSKAVHDESWSPNSCIESAWGVQDGFAEGTVRCISMPETDSKGCAYIDGVYVCPEDLDPSPILSIPNLCKEVEVNANFNFYKGQMECWTDIYGKEHCPVNNGGNLDSCVKLAEDPKCGFISSECVKGAQGASGLCYVTDVTYDCGEDVEVPKRTQDATYNCPGNIACMGGECMDVSTTVSQDLGKVYALMNAAQNVAQDMSCTGVDSSGNPTGNENVSCTAFDGEAGQCKIAVGGWQNCCESQGGIGLGTYIELILAVSRLNSSMETISKEGSPITWVSDVAGAWVDMKGEAANVVQEGLNFITKPFSSYISNIGSVKDGFIDTVMDSFKDKVVDGIKDKITTVISDYLKRGMQDLMGEAAGAAAHKAATEMVEKASAYASTALTVVSWVYTAYVVANMIVQVVYECTEDEYNTVSQNELKNCHYVGSYCKKKVLGTCIEKRRSYCCYKSPLSRILSEQIRKQGDVLGAEFNGFGSPENPQCKGIPLDKIDKIDWDRVDLSEWLAILEATGNFPDGTNLDIDSLTGQGSKVDYSGDRLNTIDRTLDHLNNVDVDGVRSEGAQHMDVDTGYRVNQ